MSHISRRKLLTGGIAAVVGTSGVAAAASRYGLIPPDYANPYGLGETLNYAAHRLSSSAPAREFPRSAISEQPFANEVSPLGPDFDKLQAHGFANWRLEVKGMIARPASLSISDLKSAPSRSHITEISCEEGWSYIAEWTGAPLSHVLETVGIDPKARYVVYRSFQKGWWDSIDIDEAMHPQTLLAYSMNRADIPVPFSGPLRIRVPRQLGYKSVKYLTTLTVTDDLKSFGKGLGAAAPEFGYSWYAGV